MKNRKGFTLIELLVVVAIIALLIAILLPSLARAKEEANLVKCEANLHSISTALSVYCSQNKDLMPQSKEFYLPGYYAPPPSTPALLSWNEALYIDGCLTIKGNQNGQMDNNATYHYPYCGWYFFQCPKHAAEFQGGTDLNSVQGYGMAWCATSVFELTPKFQPKFLVVSRNLNPNHIVVAEGWEPMGRGATATAWPAENNKALDHIYGVYQRHKRNNSYGATYLFADSHAEWSDVYGDQKHPSPLGGVATPPDTTSQPPQNIWVHP